MTGRGLTGKTVVLGVTGSIAAFKAVDVASKLTQRQARVDVIMTPAATQFVAPLSFRSVTHYPVSVDQFDLHAESALEHISLAQRADVVAVAPASANSIAKLACGIADNLLCTTVLATKAPVLLAPAMNSFMWDNPVTQENMERLKARGFHVVGPAYGRLAEGSTGRGRMEEPAVLLDAICQLLGKNGNLAGRRILVTAGGTQEPIDPVRHISNRSSGKMGYAIAEAARDRGAGVTLVTAPASIPPPRFIDIVQVGTAEEMYQAVSERCGASDVLIMAAAVADYRPETTAAQKIKKSGERLALELVRTRDILATIEGSFVKVGFAAESADLIANATTKLEKKSLDLIVANDISDKEAGFGSDNNRVTLIGRGAGPVSLPLMPKSDVAEAILDRVVELLARRQKR